MPLEEFYLTLDLPTDDEVQGYLLQHGQWQPVYSNAPERIGPTWAVVCLMVGAMLLVGAGAFLITLGLRA